MGKKLDKINTINSNKESTQATPTILDSGANTSVFQEELDNTYISLSSKIEIEDPIDSKNGPRFQGFDGSEKISNKHTYMKIPNLPREACKAHILKKLASGNLISLGQLCDAGCKAYLDQHRAYVIYKDKIILEGTRSKDTNGLWEMELPPPPEQINAAVDQATVAERIKFIHASLFSPTLHTWVQALKS